MPEDPKPRHRVCAECRHSFKGGQALFCHADLIDLDFIYGRHTYGACHLKNPNGECPDFKKRGWLARLLLPE